MKKETAFAIGIDFGGTKIEIAALSESGVFLLRRRKPNPGNYDAAIALIRDLVSATEAELNGCGSVGLGVPGSASPRTGLMRNANAVWLNGRPFREDLEAALSRPVRVANDANCFALSEAVDGAAAGADVVFGVILGTGCGGGVVVNGRLISGASGIAGEWGHNPLPWAGVVEVPGPACWCGKHNCIELWASGSGLARDYHQGSEHPDWRSEDIVAAARRGDATAVAAFDRFIDRTARSLAHVANILDPDVFVLGGGMSNVSELYDRLPDLIAKYIFSDCWEGRVVPAKFGDSSGVRGAAWLWKH